MAAAIRTYRDLIVWQKAMVFVSAVYKVSRSFPKEELFGLVSQTRRSAISIPSNIAEGYGRNATGDYVRFLHVSVGSLYEVQTQLEIARNLEYIPQKTFDELYADSREIERLLSSLIAKLAP